MKKDLRVTLTRRMLKEGLLRCLEEKPLSRITVSELCREAGINRATFYNHYQSVDMVLRGITRDYAKSLRDIYEPSFLSDQGDSAHAIEACLEYLDKERPNIQILFSENAENNVVRFEEEIVDEVIAKNDSLIRRRVEAGEDERLIYAIITASASYGLTRAWIMGKIDRTPTELVSLLMEVFGNTLI